MLAGAVETILKDLQFESLKAEKAGANLDFSRAFLLQFALLEIAMEISTDLKCLLRDAGCTVDVDKWTNLIEVNLHGQEKREGSSSEEAG